MKISDGKGEPELCTDLERMYTIVPEAAVAVKVSITGVTAKNGVVVTDAAPGKLFVIAVRLLSFHGTQWDPALGCWSLFLKKKITTSDQQKDSISFSVIE